jgi:hypothetical protein
LLCIAPKKPQITGNLDFLQELYLTFDGTALKWYLVGVGLPDGIPPSTKFLAYKKERTEKSL